MMEPGAQKAADIAISDQPLNAAQKNLLNEIYDRLSTFTQGCREIHDRAKESRKIILLQDPRQDDYEVRERKDGQETVRREPTLQLQTLKSTFNNCVADQIDNMPEAVLMPERPELTAVSEDMNDALRFVLAQNDFETFYKRRVEDFIGTGTAVTQIAWDPDMDYGKGNIAVIRYPVESFLWDPLAEDIQDARALMKVSWHPVSWYAAHYPAQAPYIRPEDGLHEGVGVLMAQEDADTSEEARAMLIEYWYRLYDAKTKQYTVNVAYAAGGALLSIHENIYRHGQYPFVLDVFTPIEGFPVGDGLIQELAPMMRTINRLNHYIDVNLRFSSKGRLLIRRNSGIDKDALADWSKDIIEGDNIDGANLQWLTHAPFNGMVTQQMMQMQTDLKMDSGQNQFTRGETAGGVTAAAAINSLQEAGNKQSRMRTNVLNQGFKDMVKQILWLMSQFYDKKRKALIVGSFGQQREVEMSPEHLFGAGKKGNTLPPPPYTVQVQVQKRNPLQVQAQNELFLQAYSMAAQANSFFPLATLFELMNVDGKEKILPVLIKNDKTMEMLKQQQEQIGQLSGMVANLQKVNVQYEKAMNAGSNPESGQEAEGQVQPAEEEQMTQGPGGQMQQAPEEPAPEAQMMQNGAVEMGNAAMPPEGMEIGGVL
jgi:hypothetical protein